MYSTALKTPFGSNSTGFGGFNTQNQPIFGQNSQMFGNASSGSFSTFGQNTPSMFGTPQPQSQQLFNSTPPSSFGTQGQSTFGSGGVFGASTQAQPTSSLFGSTNTSSFGSQAKNTGFSFSSMPSSSGLFGQPVTQPAQNPLFQSSSTVPIFNSGGFGAAQQLQTGTGLKFVPVTGTDSMQKGGSTTLINTKHHTITFMKEYENKSFEELRLEDYLANRKGVQNTAFGAAGTTFGAVAASTAPSLFGQAENHKIAFGASTFGQNTFGAPLTNTSQATGAFGKTSSTGTFGMPASSGTFGFSQPNATVAGPMFGTPTAKQSFGAQPSSLFGTTGQSVQQQQQQLQHPQQQQPQQSIPIPGAFGTSGGGLFGQSVAPQANTSMFFGKTSTSGFPTSQPQSSFTFGQQSNATAQPTSGGLFSTVSKANNASFNMFGQNTTNTFGQVPSAGFGNFGAFGTAKTMAPAFGQGNAQTTNFGVQQSSSLFGNPQTKPPSLFGTGNSGIFGGPQQQQPTFTMQPPIQSAQNTLQIQPATASESSTVLNFPDPYGYHSHLGALAPKKADYDTYSTNPRDLEKVLQIDKKFSLHDDISFGSMSLNNSPVAKRLRMSDSKEKLFETAYETEANHESLTMGVRHNVKRLMLKLENLCTNESSDSSGIESSAEDSPKSYVTQPPKKKENKKQRKQDQDNTTSKSLKSNVGNTDDDNDDDEKVQRVKTLKKSKATSKTKINTEMPKHDNGKLYGDKCNADKTKTDDEKQEENKKEETPQETIIRQAKEKAKIMFALYEPITEEELQLQCDLAQKKKVQAQLRALEKLAAEEKKMAHLLLPGEPEPGPSRILPPNISCPSKPPIAPSKSSYPLPSLEDTNDPTKYAVGYTSDVVYRSDATQTPLTSNPSRIFHPRGKDSAFLAYPLSPDPDPIEQIASNPIDSESESEWIEAADDIADAMESDSLTNPTKSTQLPVYKRPHIEIVKPSTRAGALHRCGIICTRPEYYTIPKLEDIDKYLNEDGTCYVKGFTIGRYGYGNVYFPDTIDISNLNIDEHVHFRSRELTIYSDDQTKPPVGEGLNRRAQITLDNIFPKKRDDSGDSERNPHSIIAENYADTLRGVCIKHGTTFVDYRPETGSWVFLVHHFSKYGITDSDEEESQIYPVLERRKQSTHNENAEMKKMAKNIGLGGHDYDMNELSIDALRVSCDDIFDKQSERFESASRERMQSSYHVMAMSHIFYKMAEEENCGKSAGIQMIDSDDEFSSPLKTLIVDKASIRQMIMLKPKIYKLYQHVENVPTYLSAWMTQRSVLDAAILKGRSFKVGWTGGSCFAMSLDGNLATKRTVGLIALEKTALCKQDPFGLRYTDFLELVRHHSNVEMQDHGNTYVPHFQSNAGFQMLESVAQLMNELDNVCNSDNYALRYYKNIWNLVLALWGQIESDSDVQISRRILFNNWLEIVALEKINTLEMLNLDQDADAKKIFTLLSAHQIYNAADAAITVNMPQLAMLIAEMNSSEASKYNMKCQISVWKKSVTIDSINPELLKIYLLLSGHPYYEHINVCENLDWLRSLALHFWYLSPSSKPLSYAVQQYRSAFENACYAADPKPNYDGSSDDSKDILYQILSMYGNNLNDVSKLLSPLSHTDDETDFRLSWILQHTFISLGVKFFHESDIYITTSLSNQLEQLGLMQWAIFVLLFIPEVDIKKRLIQAILDRHLTHIRFDKDDESQDSFGQDSATILSVRDELLLVTELCIPPEWIHVVKANKCAQLNKYWEAYRHLAYAQMINESCDIFLTYLVPDLMANHNYELLHQVMSTWKDMFSAVTYRWRNKVGILCDFLKIFKQVQSRPQSISASGVSNVKTVLRDLNVFVKDLRSYPQDCTDAVMSICEMSKLCAILLRTVLTSNDGECTKQYSHMIPTLLKQLFMPSDYIYEEIKHSIDIIVNTKV